MDPTDFKIYQEARRKVRERKRFYSHLMSWFICSVFFILLNLFTSDYFWAVFPILGWGIGVAFHGLRVFGIDYGEEWEERQIEKEMDRLKKKKYFEDPQTYTQNHKDQLELPRSRKFPTKWTDSDLV